VTLLALALVLASAPAEPPEATIEEFCPKGFTVLTGDACLAAPEHFTPGKLIVYFHGMLPPELKSPVELSRLGKEATARGYAVLAPRGEAGLCPWGNFDRWRCWPSDKSQLSAVGAVIERLSPLYRHAKKALHVRTLGRPLIAGFSNGGYLSTLLLSDSLIDAKGWAILHAGGVTGQSFDEMRRGPVLLVEATQDSEQYPGMKALSTKLRGQGWPVVEKEREGFHEVRAEDVSAVLDFFESLPAR
jgi:predicted esterase